ncbi:MAG: DUF5665 domain-containing protein [bacterium]|nr:DUF5665 domain-containing protein [bacterium]
MVPMQDKTEIENLTQEIKKLSANFNWRSSFIHGIVSGFGTAIGAGLLVALVILLLGQLTNMPILGQLFKFLVGNLSGIK